MPRSLSLLSFLGSAALLARTALAKQCAAFDTDGTLYVFGGSSDVSLGGASSWGSPSPKTLPTAGRPPWTGTSTQCFTSYFNNALYVVQGDSKNPGNVYIFDFAKSSWSMQSGTGAPTLDGASSILDHDTNVLYTVTAAGEMWDLDMGNIKNSATSAKLAWNDVGKSSFPVGGKPTIAEASQHILFFGVGGTAAGSAPIFVIHFSFFQPDVQTFPSKSGSALPTQHGQVAGIPFTSTNVAGDQILFVPDDFSNAYVVTHWTNPGTVGSTSGAPSKIVDFINSTQVLAAPTSHDANAVYAATDSSFVQLDSAGNIYYIANAISDFAVTSGSRWSKMSYTLAGLSGSGGTNGTSTTSSGSSSGGSSSGSGSSSGTGSGADASPDDVGSGAAGLRVGLGLAAVVLGAAATLL